MTTDQRIHDALAAELPLPGELRPNWKDVLARAEHRSPVAQRRWTPVPRRALVAATLAAAALIFGGLAIAGAFGPLHAATLAVNPSTVGGASGVPACDLVGKRADHVAAVLAGHGIGVEWRYTHWGTSVASTGATSPSAVTGGTTDAVSSVPNDSVVWDVVADGTTKAFVFVQAPNDPNAPRISPEACGSPATGTQLP